METYELSVSQALENFGRRLEEIFRNSVCKHEWTVIQKHPTYTARIGDIYYQECKHCRLINVVATEKKED